MQIHSVENQGRELAISPAPSKMAFVQIRAHMQVTLDVLDGLPWASSTKIPTTTNTGECEPRRGFMIFSVSPIM